MEAKGETALHSFGGVEVVARRAAWRVIQSGLLSASQQGMPRRSPVGDDDAVGEEFEVTGLPGMTLG